MAIRNAAYAAAIQAIQAGQFDKLSSTDDIPRWPRPVRDSPVTRLLSRTATKFRRPPRICTRHQGMTVVSHRPWYERRPTTPDRPRRPRTTSIAGAEHAPPGADLRTASNELAESAAGRPRGESMALRRHPPRRLRDDPGRRASEWSVD